MVAAGGILNSIMLFIRVNRLSVMLFGSMTVGVWRTSTVVTTPVWLFCMTIGVPIVCPMNFPSSTGIDASGVVVVWVWLAAKATAPALIAKIKRIAKRLFLLNIVYAPCNSELNLKIKFCYYFL